MIERMRFSKRFYLSLAIFCSLFKIGQALSQERLIELPGDKQDLKQNLKQKQEPRLGLSGLSIGVIQDNAGKSRISIKGQALSKAVAFALENPPRIVIDLPATSSVFNRTAIPKGNSVVSKIRVASHPDKLRVVVDLSPTSKPDFSQVVSESSIEITLGIPEQAAILAPTQAFTPTPPSEASVVPTVISGTATAVYTKTPGYTPVSTAKNTVVATPIVPTSTPVVVSTPVFTPTVTPLSLSTRESPAVSGLKLLDMKFDYVEPEHQPVAKIVLNSPTEFKLVKQDETTFVLTIPRASLANSQAGLIQFAPQDFVGLGYLMPKVDGSDLKIVIGVERNQRLASANKGNELLLRVISK